VENSFPPGGGGLTRIVAFAAAAVCRATAPLASSLDVQNSVDDPIQPGDPLLGDDGDPFCTLNFIYDSQTNDTVYLSTAAHCVDKGQVVTTTNHEAFGTVEFVGDAGDVTRDFVLIRVHDDAVPTVQPSVRGYPDMPTGVAEPSETQTGDLVPMSGWGVATNVEATTRENRTGVLVEHRPNLVRMEGPVTNGDSGGPWMHESGQALGIASRITATVSTGSEDIETAVGTIGAPAPDAFVGDQGPTVTSLLDAAADHGYDLTLRTV